MKEVSLNDLKTMPPEAGNRLSPDEISKIIAGVDPRDIGRPFDAEELELIRMIQGMNRIKGPPRFQRHDPYARHRRVPRGDRHKVEGKLVGPNWSQAVVFQDDDNKVVDLEATRFEQARQYLLRRRLHANRVTSFKKLGKAARILANG